MMGHVHPEERRTHTGHPHTGISVLATRVCTRVQGCMHAPHVCTQANMSAPHVCTHRYVCVCAHHRYTRVCVHSPHTCTRRHASHTTHTHAHTRIGVSVYCTPVRAPHTRACRPHSCTRVPTRSFCGLHDRNAGHLRKEQGLSAALKLQPRARAPPHAESCSQAAPNPMCPLGRPVELAKLYIVRPSAPGSTSLLALAVTST